MSIWLSSPRIIRSVCHFGLAILAAACVLPACTTPGTQTIACDDSRFVFSFNEWTNTAQWLSAETRRDGKVSATDQWIELDFPSVEGALRLRVRVDRYSGRGTRTLGEPKTVDEQNALINETTCRPAQKVI